MARQRAKDIRVQMRVPTTFRDRVMKDAQAAGIDATVYLENKKVVPNV